MNIRKIVSLGYRTDMIFQRFDGEVIERGDYWVIRSPSNPTFYWGNFLLFAKPPREGDFQRWTKLFADEIGSLPETQHQVFGWDSPEGEMGVVQPFLQAGFRPSLAEVMTSRDLRSPAKPNLEVQIRALQTEKEWAQAVELQVVCREPEFSESGYRTYRRRQMARYQRMVSAGLGDWYGAFIDQVLVASLGIFHDGSLGRFQSVETHPDYRRQGIAGTLVAGSGQQALEKFGLQQLVIVAESDSSAARLYQSLGYRPVEKQVGLEWWVEMQGVNST